MRSIIKYFPVSMFAFVLTSCYYDKADKLYPVSPSGCDTSNITYTGTIKPIMLLNCATAGCHDAASQAGGFDYSTRNGMITEIQNGKLLGSIKHGAGYIAMPQSGGKLSDCDIQKITIWINNGYPG